MHFISTEKLNTLQLDGHTGRYNNAAVVLGYQEFKILQSATK